jgi:hypothetical protein
MRIRDISDSCYLAKALDRAIKQDSWVLETDDDWRINVSHNGWVDLEPGRIDTDAVSWFRYGNCVSLAQAMHARTGFPIAMVRCHPASSSGNSFVHALLRLPSGGLLDISGEHSEAEVLREWEEALRGRQDVWIEDMMLTEVVEIAGHINEMPEFERMVTKHFADLVLIEQGLLDSPWWTLLDYDVELPADCAIEL